MGGVGRKEEEIVVNGGGCGCGGKMVVGEVGFGSGAVAAKLRNKLWDSLRHAVPVFVGIQSIVAQELKYVAMVRIRSRFDGCVNDAAFVVSELGGGVLRNDVEFLDCIYARCIANLIILLLAVGLAIKEKQVGLLPVSVDVGSSSGKLVLRQLHRLRVDIGRAR